MILESGCGFTNTSHYSQGIQGGDTESCKSNTITKKTTQSMYQEDTFYFSSCFQELLMTLTLLQIFVLVFPNPFAYALTSHFSKTNLSGMIHLETDKSNLKSLL